MEQFPCVSHPQEPLCAGALCDLPRCSGEPGLAPEGLDGFIPIIVSVESEGIHSPLIADAGEETFPLERLGNTEFQQECPGRRHNRLFRAFWGLGEAAALWPWRAGRGVNVAVTALAPPGCSGDHAAPGPQAGQRQPGGCAAPRGPPRWL